MRRTQLTLFFILLMAVLGLGACSGNMEVNFTPSPVVIDTVTVTNPPTIRPTRTPLPSKTPDGTATQQTQDWYSQIQDYYEKGYLDTQEWRLTRIDDFNADWARIDWFQSWLLGESAENNFIFSANYKWSSDTKTPNQSGCGLIFGIHSGNYYYVVFLANTEIIFSTIDLDPASSYVRLGVTRGTGRVDISEPTEADFTIIVQNQYSYVIVNDKVVGEYTLPKNLHTNGSLAASVLSGTNKGYGTRCEMTEIRLWEPK